MAQSSQFSAAKVLEAAQQAEAGGNREYAVQFYRHVAEQHPQSAEAVTAHEGLGRLLNSAQPVGELSGERTQQAVRAQSPEHTQPAERTSPQERTQPPARRMHSVQSQSSQPSLVQGSPAQSSGQSSGQSSVLAHRVGNDAGEAANGAALAGGHSAGQDKANGANRTRGVELLNGAERLNGAGSGASADHASQFAGGGPLASSAPLTAIAGQAANQNQATSQNQAANQKQLGQHNQPLSYQPAQHVLAPPGQGSETAHQQIAPATSALPQSPPLPTIKDQYRVGRAVALVVGILGWVIVVTAIGGAIGVLAGIGGMGAFITAAGGTSITVVVIGALAAMVGLSLVFTAQLARATFDNATATRELVMIERTRQR